MMLAQGREADSVAGCRPPCGRSHARPRVLLGLTQHQLADLIGVTYQQEHKYEKGINRVAAGRLYRLPGRSGSRSATFTMDSCMKALPRRPPTNACCWCWPATFWRSATEGIKKRSYRLPKRLQRARTARD